MPRTDQLFELIKSLSKTEKTYFKKYSTRQVKGEQNNYVKLYNAIESLSIYDENKIRKQFRKEAFLKQLPVAKNYLFHLILRSLNEYNAENKLTFQLREMLGHIEVLYNKRLYNQSHKILRKATSLAELYDQQEVQLELAIWQERLYRGLSDFDALSEYTKHGFSREDALRHKIKNRRAYKKIESEVLLITKRETKTKNLNRLHKLLNDPLLRTQDAAKSYTARLLFHNIHSLSAFTQNKPNEACASLQTLIAFMEEHPHHIKRVPNNYMAALNNLSEVANDIKAFEIAFLAIEKLKTFPAKTTDDKIYQYIRSSEQILKVALRSGRIKIAIQSIGSTTDMFEQFKHKISQANQLILQYHFSYLLFVSGNFESALDWINQVVAIKKIVQPNIQRAGHLLNLLIHLELGNEQLLEYLVVSTEQYLKKQHLLFELDRSLIQFIKITLPKLTSIDSKKAAFKALHTYCSKLVEQPESTAILDHLNLLLWIESKIQAVPFHTLFKSPGKENR